MLATAALIFASCIMLTLGMAPLPSDRDPPKNCLDLLQNGMTKSGVNVIYPYLEHPDYPVLALCDQETDGGGWVVIQKRYDGSEDFYRSWTEYSEGFGNVASEHYLGNDKIAALTEQSVNQLRVELEDWFGFTVYAHYQGFHLDANNNYQLQVLSYEGTAGDSLMDLDNGAAFSTFDADHDSSNNDNVTCAQGRYGGWWYGGDFTCGSSNLNGRYYPSNQGSYDGNWWWAFRMYWNMKATTMKVRPSSFPIAHNGALHDAHEAGTQ